MVGSNLYGLFLVAFLVIKLGGTMLAGWSFWWVLFPLVPDLVAIFKALGVL